MKRNIERKLFLAGSIWNIINAFITVFAYSMWVRSEGISYLRTIPTNVVEVNGNLVDSLFTVSVTYGLLLFVIGFINFFIIKKIEDGKIQKKIILWTGALIFLSLLTLDIISLLCYLIMFVVYQSKNKAIRLAEA
ncbi:MULTISPECIES: hypothetical protein [Carnobacterium]|uniref:hypothetical protein n=1 Tax=Carnobacterium TaxID=2747 RepID=UPI00203B0454|nr:hypothetical protein [Carnobacterium inhibens]MCM3513286.1 hypothetical protein [Carnobacterium inhibens]